MSSCVNSTTGKPKIKYSNRSETRKSIKKIQIKTNHHVSAYRCNNCGSWHIGRTPALHEWHIRMRRNKAVEERLAGKLIAALKSNLNHPKRVS